MIFIVLVPGWVWTVSLSFALAKLIYLALYRIGYQSYLLSALLAFVACKALIASSAALATSIYAIGKFPCLAGILGTKIAPFIILAESSVVIYLSLSWPRDSKGKRILFQTWCAVWLLISFISLLAYMRSAALCTV